MWLMYRLMLAMKLLAVCLNGDWGYYNFFAESPAMSDLHINYKEVLAVNFVVEHWAPLWSCKHVIIHS